MPTAATFRELCLALRHHATWCRGLWAPTRESLTRESFGRAVSGYRCEACDWVVSYEGPPEIPSELGGACAFVSLPADVGSRARLVAWLEGEPLHTEYWLLCRTIAHHACAGDRGFRLNLNEPGGPIATFTCRGCGIAGSLPLSEIPPSDDPLAPPFPIVLSALPDAVKTASWAPWLRGEGSPAFDRNRFREELYDVRLRRAPYTNDPHFANPTMLRAMVPPLGSVRQAQDGAPGMGCSPGEVLREKMARAEDACRDLYVFAKAHGYDLGPRPRFEVREDRGPGPSRYERGPVV